jgi:Protein prenyltransferase alpha subunit repeat
VDCLEVYNSLCTQAAKADAATKAVLKARSNGDLGKATMMGSAAVLAVFPDLFTLWNVRREALAPLLNAQGEGVEQLAAAELALTRKCLTEHPKSYSAWHHRRWVLEKGLSNLDEELVAVQECAHLSRFPCPVPEFGTSACTAHRVGLVVLTLRVPGKPPANTDADEHAAECKHGCNRLFSHAATAGSCTPRGATQRTSTRGSTASGS